KGQKLACGILNLRKLKGRGLRKVAQFAQQGLRFLRAAEHNLKGNLALLSRGSQLQAPAPNSTHARNSARQGSSTSSSSGERGGGTTNATGERRQPATHACDRALQVV